MTVIDLPSVSLLPLPIDPLAGFVQTLTATVLPGVIRAAGLLLFQTPDLTSAKEIQGLTRASLATADSLVVLFLMYCGFRVITSGAEESRYAVKALLTRIFGAGLMANASLLICSSLVSLDNALVVGLLGPDPAQRGWTELSTRMQTANLGGGILDSLMALASVVLVIFLVLIYIGRDLLLLVLTVIAPLALMTRAVPDLSGICAKWWRAYAAALFMQLGHALLIAIGVDLLAHPEWLGTGSSTVISGLIIVALFYVMVRLPFLLYQWVFEHPVSQHPVVQRVVTVVKTAATAAMAAA
ncbi:MAG TPA: hypothetical protein VIN56_02340 [Candidatus Dormibacteraeota bacterium]